MNKAEKVERLEKHVKTHPTDYQAVIGLLKARSDLIEHGLYLQMIERKKKVAYYRRKCNEKRKFRDRIR